MRIRFDNRRGRTFTIELIHEIWCRSQKCQCHDQLVKTRELDIDGISRDVEITKTLPGSITVQGGAISQSYPDIVLQLPGVKARLKDPNGGTRLKGVTPRELAGLLR